MQHDHPWPIVELGEACDEITVGFVGPMASEYVEAGVPFIRSLNVRPFRIDKKDIKYVSPQFHARIQKSRLRAGDVVIVRTGVPGTTAVVPDWLDGGNCSDLVIVRPSNRLDSRFLCYHMNAVAHHVGRMYAVGAVQQHFNIGAAKTLPIPLPPLPTQRAIAAVLGSLDDKIEQNRRTARALERLARAIFRAWFVDFEPIKAKAGGAASFPSMPQDVFDALPTTFTDSDLGPVPAGWDVGTLGDNCGINERAVRAGEIEGEIEYVDISSVTVGRLTGVQRVPYSEAPSRARRRVRHGDTIWSCVRPNHKSYLFIHSPPDNRLVSTGFAVLTPREFGPSFLHDTVTQPEFVHHLVSNADGSAYPAVRSDHFASATVVVPPKQCRDAFETLTMPMRDVLASAERESVRLAEMRDYLLPQLLSGQVPVGVSDA